MLKMLHPTILPFPDFLDPDKLRTGDELIPLKETIPPRLFRKHTLSTVHSSPREVRTEGKRNIRSMALISI